MGIEVTDGGRDAQPRGQEHAGNQEQPGGLHQARTRHGLAAPGTGTGQRDHTDQNHRDGEIKEWAHGINLGPIENDARGLPELRRRASRAASERTARAALRDALEPGKLEGSIGGREHRSIGLLGHARR